MAQYFLSEDDRQVINQLLARTKLPTPRRPQQNEPPLQPADVCIAKATEDIAGLEKVVGTADPEITAGTCNIYRIQDVEGTDTLVQLYSELSHKVYNLNSTTITEDQYFVVTKDNFGKWVSGNSSSVQFAKLDEDLDAGDSGEASIWSGDPLADSGDTVTVYDWFLEADMKLESGVKVMLTPISGKLYVTQSNTCPVDQE